METLFATDSALFVAVNQTLANPATDLLMPWLTNDIVLRVILSGIIVGLLIKGPTRLRVLALGGLLAVGFADQLSSAVVKPLIGRIRPCHTDWFSAGINLLVNCGAGKSFPSSHAANTFALATFISIAQPTSSYSAFNRWALFSFAALVALSRVFVGVHYPADIFAGAALGMTVGYTLSLGYKRIALIFWN